MEENRRHEKEVVKEDKRKPVREELENAKRKKSELEEEIDSLLQSATNAEENKSMMVLKNSNIFWKSAREKKSLLPALEKRISNLNEKIFNNRKVA